MKPHVIRSDLRGTSRRLWRKCLTIILLYVFDGYQMFTAIPQWRCLEYPRHQLAVACSRDHRNHGVWTACRNTKLETSVTGAPRVAVPGAAAPEGGAAAKNAMPAGRGHPSAPIRSKYFCSTKPPNEWPTMIGGAGRVATKCARSAAFRAMVAGGALSVGKVLFPCRV